MDGDAETYQPLSIAPGFSVQTPDGWVSTIIQRPGDALIQISYWIVDSTPLEENIHLPYDHPEHYRTVTRHTLVSSVRLKPDVVLQMAIGLLDSLTKLPDDVRTKYGLPKEVVQVGPEVRQ
jgi:hypothetical protein